MALDPIVMGCDWQATLIVEPTLGREASAVVSDLTGATVAVRLIDQSGTVRSTSSTSTITSAAERTIEAIFTAAETALLVAGSYTLDVRVTTTGAKVRPVQVRERVEVRPFTIGAR